jgi:hypothetical protein
LKFLQIVTGDDASTGVSSSERERQIQHGCLGVREWEHLADSLKVRLVLLVLKQAPGISSFGHILGKVGESTKHELWI